MVEVGGEHQGEAEQRQEGAERRLLARGRRVDRHGVGEAELLGHVREDGFEPVEAWENHDAILELWRESGIPEVHDARVESSQSP